MRANKPASRSFVPSGENNGAVDTPRRYGRDQFHYDAQRNAYRCPQGQGLSDRGTKQQGGKYFPRYVSRQPVCAVCPVRPHCLSAKTAYREIYRWEHEVLLDAHLQRMQAEGAVRMRQRASLAEHPFGTLKRGCGWLHFLVRGKEKASGEPGLLMLRYNFRRLLTILGINGRRQVLNRRNNAMSAA